MSAASDLLDAVCKHHRANEDLNFLTDSESYPDKVLLAIWRPAAAFVVTVNRAEWNGVKTAEIFGFTYQRPPAIERAMEQKK